MSENKDAISWQTKLKIVVSYPSVVVTGALGGQSAEVFQAGRISISRNREQRNIMTISEARKGFTTVERDYTLTMTMYETDPNISKMEQLYSSNEFFDIALVEVSKEGLEFASEWSISKILAAGCKVESVRTTYDPMMLPVREYTIKFLRSTTSFKEGPVPLTTDGKGLYWKVNIQWAS